MHNCDPTRLSVLSWLLKYVMNYGFLETAVETTLIIFGFIFASCVENLAACSSDGLWVA